MKINLTLSAKADAHQLYSDALKLNNLVLKLNQKSKDTKIRILS